MNWSSWEVWDDIHDKSLLEHFAHPGDKPPINQGPHGAPTGQYLRELLDLRTIEGCTYTTDVKETGELEGTSSMGMDREVMVEGMVIGKEAGVRSSIEADGEGGDETSPAVTINDANSNGADVEVVGETKEATAGIFGAFVDHVAALSQSDDDEFGHRLLEMVGPFVELVINIEPTMPLTVRERREMTLALPILPSLRNRYECTIFNQIKL
jgi:hypothetical protein